MRDVVICDIVLSNFSRNHMCDHDMYIRTFVGRDSRYNYNYYTTTIIIQLRVQPNLTRLCKTHGTTDNGIFHTVIFFVNWGKITID